MKDQFPAQYAMTFLGFFPLKNFVMHMPADRTQHADCDILAVRFPLVFEDIGGQAADWDQASFARRGVPLDATAVLIVQVKTGTQRTPGEAFNRDRLQRAVKRVGLWGADTAEGIADDLRARAFVRHEGATVAKLLIASRPVENRTYLSMSHDEAQDFIERRF